MYPTRALLCLFFLAASTGAFAFKPVATSGKDKLALGGHDVVAYHEHGRAVEGHVLYRFEWRGATWQFARRSHLLAFKKEPVKYAPAFGGYCVAGVSQDEVVVCTGEHFFTYEGRLFIVSTREHLQALKEDPEKYINLAQPQWERWMREYEAGQARERAGEERPEATSDATRA
jgi:YHS domain-containing protein